MNRFGKIMLASALALSAPAMAAPVVLRPAVKLQLAPRPANADMTVAKIRLRLTPRGANWARAEALRLSSGKISPEIVRNDAQSVCSTGGGCLDFANMPIEDAVLLMTMLIDNDAEQDLRGQLDEMQREQQQKQEARAAKEQMAAQQSNDAGELSQLRLQMMMDRRRKVLEALSSIMKKYEDTNDSVIKNMK